MFPRFVYHTDAGVFPLAGPTPPAAQPLRQRRNLPAARLPAAEHNSDAGRRHRPRRLGPRSRVPSLDVGVAARRRDGRDHADRPAVRAGQPRYPPRGASTSTRSMTMAGRPTKNSAPSCSSPPASPSCTSTRCRRELAGGGCPAMSRILSTPTTAPSRYALELVVRDADVRAIDQEEGRRQVRPAQRQPVARRELGQAAARADAAT